MMIEAAQCYICKAPLNTVREYNHVKNSWNIRMSCGNCRLVWSGQLLLDMQSLSILINKEKKD